MWEIIWEATSGLPLAGLGRGGGGLVVVVVWDGELSFDCSSQSLLGPDGSSSPGKLAVVHIPLQEELAWGRHVQF